MWVYIPGQSATQASVQEQSTRSDWPSSWRFQTLAAYCDLSGTPSAAPVWCRRWRKDAWMKHLCTAMCEPSTARRGVDAWTSSLRDTPAQPSPTPENAGASPICGANSSSRSSSSSRTLKSLLCSSRTSLDTSLWDSQRSANNWKAWATALRLACLQRRKSARRTSGSDCSSWPTAQSEDSESCGNHPEATDSLTGAARRLWPTATEGDSTNTANATSGRSGKGKKFQIGVTLIDAGRRQGARRGTGDELMLPGQAEQWQTPGAMLGEDSQTHRSGNRTGELLLTGQAQSWESAWPTPKGRDHKGQSQRGEHGLKDALANMAENTSQSSPQAPAPATTGDPSSKQTRRLNPRFVCWLMGWPLIVGIGSAHWETAWSLWRRRMRSELSRMHLDLETDAA